MPIVDARVVIVWATASGSSINTADIQFDDAVLDYDAAAEAVGTAIEDSFLLQLTDNLRLAEVKVGDDVVGGSYQSNTFGGTPGAGTNPSVAFGFTKQVGSGRNGRWYVPGVAEAFVDDKGRLTTAAVDALNGNLVTMLADLATAGVTLTVKQKLGNYQPVAAMSCRNFVTLQRRRLDRARG
uniref:Uncharacterized protein n=1 Tax=uncultured prokaryote TaxID=198431 RepID=A0A0H5QL37_9ZZZZ|nr:hypothetical protein [uncultured prokaryote]